MQILGVYNLATPKTQRIDGEHYVKIYWFKQSLGLNLRHQ